MDDYTKLEVRIMEQATKLGLKRNVRNMYSFLRIEESLAGEKRPSYEEILPKM